MTNSSTPKPKRKIDWVLNQSAFQQLLNWIDGGTDSEGQRYLQIRRRLVLYFDRKHCLSADELADETLNRVARRLEEEGAITTDTPAHYCYIVAHFVFLESLRQPNSQELFTGGSLTTDPNEQKDEGSRQLECLERCLENLNPEDRRIIVDYYQEEQHDKIENRKAIAAKLKLTKNALSIRACRIRIKLDACVNKCLSKNK